MFMKKFILVFILAAVALATSGCSSGSHKTENYNYSGEVLLIVQYEYKQPFSTAELITKTSELEGYLAPLVVKDKLEASVHAENGVAEVVLWFVDYSTFNDFFASDNSIKVTQTIRRNTFFITRSTLFSNPLDVVLEKPVLSYQIISLASRFLLSFGDGEFLYAYVLWTDTRISETNAAFKEQYLGEFLYYFPAGSSAGDLRTPEVWLYERYANTPIWYALAVAITALTMVIIYFACKPRRKVP